MSLDILQSSVIHRGAWSRRFRGMGAGGLGPPRKFFQRQWEDASTRWIADRLTPYCFAKMPRDTFALR